MYYVAKIFICSCVVVAPKRIKSHSKLHKNYTEPSNNFQHRATPYQSEYVIYVNTQIDNLTRKFKLNCTNSTYISSNGIVIFVVHSAVKKNVMRLVKARE